MSPPTPNIELPRSARTYARVGLIGNPSDGYGGAAVAFAFEELAAELSVAQAGDGFAIVWHGKCVYRSDSLAEALATPADEVEHGAARLILAAGRRLQGAGGRIGSHPPITIRGQSAIPFQAGLSGSSAIVISALRLLAPMLGVTASNRELAVFALESETRELGIAAGPMDRIAQVRGGVLFMDFAERMARVETLEVPVPSGLYVAWDRSAGVASGRVHGSLRERFDAGEPAVLAAMQRFRELAFEGRDALLAGDRDGIASLLDENFDLRREVVGVTDRDEALVTIGRSRGASAKLCGSGGAVVGIANASRMETLRAAYEEAGNGWLIPTVVAGAGAIGTAEASSFE